jgi:hypothetical protein
MCTENAMTQTRTPITTKPTKVGDDDFVIVIHQEVLAAAGIGQDTPVHITSGPGGLTITAAPDANLDAKFWAAVDETNRKYGDMLRRLAQ